MNNGEGGHVRKRGRRREKRARARVASSRRRKTRERSSGDTWVTRAGAAYYPTTTLARRFRAERPPRAICDGAWADRVKCGFSRSRRIARGFSRYNVATRERSAAGTHAAALAVSIDQPRERFPVRDLPRFLSAPVRGKCAPDAVTHVKRPTRPYDRS